MMIRCLSTLFLFNAVSGQQPDEMNSRGIPYPSFRFLQYRYIPNVLLPNLDSLGYTEETWNEVGTNTIELIAYEAQAMGQEVISSLGFTPESWDCFINHYSFFDWSDLSDLGVQDYFAALGWNADNWGSSMDAPDIVDMTWDELTDEQRGNATEVCYFEHTWNGENLIFWSTGPPTDSPTANPTTQPTAAPLSVQSDDDEKTSDDGSSATMALPWKSLTTTMLALGTSLAFVVGLV